MGILAEPLQLIRSLKLPEVFSVCELGDQYVTEGEGVEADGHYLASKFYKRLGCSRYESLDANGRGTVTMDLNGRLPKGLIGQFDIVTDFGTGEHVFNQAQIWLTLHELCKKGGYIVFDRPSQGYEGHCFYLLQWNLISALAHANWYEVLHLYERETTRGVLIRGVLRKRTAERFVTPQQGRYVKDLAIDFKAKRRGPDHKSQELRVAGLFARRKKDV